MIRRVSRSQSLRRAAVRTGKSGRSAGDGGVCYEPMESRHLLAAWVPHELLVQFEPSVNPDRMQTVRESGGAVLLESIHTTTMKASRQGVLERLQIPADRDMGEAVRHFQSLPGVRHAEPNWIYSIEAVSNDTHYTNGGLWGMYGSDSTVVVGPTGTTNQFGTQAERAWNAGYTGSSSVVVGVIDEGIQVAHPDLAANVWVNPYDPVDGIDNDGNGFIDDTWGWDFVNNDRTVYDSTADDHATHVAGTIGGVGGNGQGVAGVNWNVTMVSLKFLGTGGGTTANAVKAIDYLTDLKTRHGMNVVTSNNSWGGGGFSQSLLDAITRGAQQQILFVAAAGNSNANNNTTNYYPSNYNTTTGAGYDAVISVASITSSGAKSSFSSYGSTTVDLAAPGSGIMSTVPSSTYASYNGTSMATPHVAGAVALYRSVAGSRTGAQTRAAILNNTTATTSMSSITVTGGRLDVAKVVSSAIQATLSVSGVSVMEGFSGTTPASFTVTLSAATIDPVTVSFASSNLTATAGSDYSAASGTLTFQPGTLTRTATVQVLGDGVIEPDETFLITLSSPAGASLGQATATGVILNDDVALPRITVFPDKSTEGDESNETVNLAVRLSVGSPVTVTVDYQTISGTALSGQDFQARTGTVVFAPWSVWGNIRITILGDTVSESTEEFQVVLSSPVNAALEVSTGTARIMDDDIGGFRFLSAGPGSGQSGGTDTVSQDSVANAVRPEQPPLRRLKSVDADRQSGLAALPLAGLPVRETVPGDRKWEPARSDRAWQQSDAAFKAGERVDATGVLTPAMADEAIQSWL